MIMCFLLLLLLAERKSEDCEDSVWNKRRWEWGRVWASTSVVFSLSLFRALIWRKTTDSDGKYLNILWLCFSPAPMSSSTCLSDFDYHFANYTTIFNFQSFSLVEITDIQTGSVGSISVCFAMLQAFSFLSSLKAHRENFQLFRQCELSN